MSPPEIWAIRIFINSATCDAAKSSYLSPIKRIKSGLRSKNASENEMSEYVFKNTKSIDQVSIELVSKGITSIEELIRINNIRDNGDI